MNIRWKISISSSQTVKNIQYTTLKILKIRREYCKYFNILLIYNANIS